MLLTVVDAFFSYFSFLRSALDSFFESTSVGFAKAGADVVEAGGAGLACAFGVPEGDADFDPNVFSFTSLMKLGEPLVNGGLASLNRPPRCWNCCLPPAL